MAIISAKPNSIDGKRRANVLSPKIAAEIAFISAFKIPVPKVFPLFLITVFTPAISSSSLSVKFFALEEDGVNAELSSQTFS